MKACFAYMSGDHHAASRKKPTAPDDEIREWRFLYATDQLVLQRSTPPGRSVMLFALDGSRLGASSRTSQRSIIIHCSARSDTPRSTTAQPSRRGVLFGLAVSAPCFVAQTQTAQAYGGRKQIQAWMPVRRHKPRIAGLLLLPSAFAPRA